MRLWTAARWTGTNMVTPAGEMSHVPFVMQAEVFNPLAAFGVRPLPAVGARAGRWLADNLAQIFRHFDEWKLNESHISYIVSH